VAGLLVQLGLIKEEDENADDWAGQPISHDSALPPGFGTLQNNGLNGARISRKGKLSSRRPAAATTGLSFPSDPYGTGLSFNGGLPNGHPDAGRARPGGKRKPAGGRSDATKVGGGQRKPGNKTAAARKPRKPAGDWQPRSANAHESQLGRLGGRKTLLK